MIIGLTALSLAVVIATGSTALHAQSTQATEEDTSEATQLEDQLSFGEEGPQIGQTYTAEVIGDWELQCIKTETDEDPCQMYQLMADTENQPIAEFSLFRLPEGGRAVAGATLVVPLESSLPQQVSIAIDGQAARRYPYAFCNTVGCYARIGLTAEDVAAYRAGNSATITIVPALAPDQQVQLELSLTGFTKTYEKVSIADQ